VCLPVEDQVRHLVRPELGERSEVQDQALERGGLARILDAGRRPRTGDVEREPGHAPLLEEPTSRRAVQHLCGSTRLDERAQGRHHILRCCVRREGGREDVARRRAHLLQAFLQRSALGLALRADRAQRVDRLLGRRGGKTFDGARDDRR
jgi:hypothetical protein